MALDNRTGYWESGQSVHWALISHSKMVGSFRCNIASLLPLSESSAMFELAQTK